MIYIIIFAFILLGIITAYASSNRLHSYFNKISNNFAEINKTGNELLLFFINKLKLNTKILERSNENKLDNSYNVIQKTIFLSNFVNNDKSVGSLTVAMHELGHAVQHNKKSKLFYLYFTLSVLNRITSFFFAPLIIFLIISLFLSTFYINLALILLLSFYVINLLSRILIIPLEKNASKIAINLLKEYKIFDEEELKCAKKLLNLALFTYIGGFFINYINFFRKLIRSF